jgi:hypothetical protein
MRFMEYRRATIAILSAVAAATVPATAYAQKARDELPIPSAPQQDLTAIQRAFTPQAPPPLKVFPKLRDDMKDLPAVIRDSTFDINFRSYYRDVVTNNPNSVSVNEAWAAGGWVGFETGRVLDMLSAGAVFYTSLPLYAPIEYDSAGLLLPGQLGYGVVGQLYGRLRIIDDHTITGGRYYYDTPYLGPWDNRMTPQTFYGYTLTGTFGDSSEGGPSFRYGGGYIAAVKQRNSNTFISMSRAAGANVDNGVGVLGGRFKWGPVSVGAIEYYNQDTINIAYAEGLVGHRFPFGVDTILALQYADQRSTGLNLASGGNYFNTNQFGARLDVGYDTGIFTVAYSVVNPNFNMQNPWSANPIYTDAITLSFQRAGESALMVGGSYVFTRHGLPGIAASVYYYQGWTGASAGPPTVENEWDFTVDWRPSFVPLSGLWLRTRYAHSSINQNNMLSTTDEVRITLNYGLKLY